MKVRIELLPDRIDLGQCIFIECQTQLPQRQFDAQWVLEVLAYRQQRNHAAYLSHRKRRLALLNQLK